MGILNLGIIGPVRKTIGPVVAYTMKGQNIIRSKAAHYTDKKSEAQQLQRARHTALVQLARLSLGHIRTSFETKLAKQSGYNAFMAANLKASTFVGNSAVIDYSKLSFSKGTKLRPKGFAFGYIASSNTIELAWDNNANDTTGFANDRVKIVLVDAKTNEVFVVTPPATRADEIVSIPSPISADLVQKTINGYLCFGPADTLDTIPISDDEWNELADIFE